MALWNLKPVLRERIWGGDKLATLFGRQLPPDARIGESWELCDRPEAQCEVQPQGKTLHELWTGPEHSRIFGTAAPQTERFPILIKILDAREKLSLQVHPPAHCAAQFDGEPKTEMWYFLETDPDAEIYVGFKKGVTKESFERSLEEKTVADSFHHLKTAPEEAMFLPSGRAHGIGGGNVILEIQQNSDTTFRVYDWDRMGTDGKPRALHKEQSLACIDFKDIEPVFVQPHGETLIRCVYFNVYRVFMFKDETRRLGTDPGSFLYLFVSKGRFAADGQTHERGASLFAPADSGIIDWKGLDEENDLICVSWPE